MSDLHALPFLQIPPDILAAFDNRTYRFALQPYHHLVRIGHILSVSFFFGAVVLLDLRLLGVGAKVALRGLAELLMPSLYVAFAVSMITGVLLFLYDPVHVGSHAYFSLKMILIVLGMANAAYYGRYGFAGALRTAGPLPAGARLFGGLSLTFWLGAMICACLNVEAAPKVTVHGF